VKGLAGNADRRSSKLAALGGEQAQSEISRSPSGNADRSASGLRADSRLVVVRHTTLSSRSVIEQDAGFGHD